MTEIKDYLANRQKLIDAGAYDPRDERDACGVGLVAALDAEPRREIVEMGIRALKNVWHRGAVDADGKTGDGAGIRIDVPQGFFREQASLTGHEPTDETEVCVGQIFLPRTDLTAQEAARTIVEAEILHFGFYLFGWRQVPVDVSVIGRKAADTRPEIEQVMFHDRQNRDAAELERTLYVCRRRIERRVREAGLPDFYICSLSQRNLIYKGMFLAEDIDNFYPDLKDERFISAVAIYHQRYSTNTFPQWWLAQPFRMLAHNGEINTLRGNLNWMKSHEIRMVSEAFSSSVDDVKPVVSSGSSDSAALDAVFEMLVKAGRSAPMAKALLIPEAWSKRDSVSPEHSALYGYANAVMEPWDGPAAVCAYDGRWAIAGLDRNGLRPLRYALTSENILAVGSETGMCPLNEDTIVRRGRVPAGGLVAANLEEGRFYEHNEIIDELSSRHPYVEWLENVKELEPDIGPGPEPRMFDRAELLRRQTAAGFTMEDLELILAPMAETGKEAIGSMGDDTPPAVLSGRYRPLSHFFRQNFSQVTNPPIDPIREERVMSLKTRFKNLGNILTTDEAQTNVFVLESPVLTTGMYQRLVEVLGPNRTEIDCTFDPGVGPAGDGAALKTALARICSEAEDAVRSAGEHIILTDEHVGEDRVAIPMILATAAVHTHLVKQGLRTFCSITVRSAECMDTHYFAVLVGVGATCVNAYLAQDCLAERHERGLIGDVPLGDSVKAFKTAIEGGLLKILSKMGISVISSYRGGYNFEALGLSRALVADYFPGMTSRISGIGLAGLERRALEQHEKAYDEQVVSLPVGGFYRLRASGETHALSGPIIHALQEACTDADYSGYKKFAEALHKQPPVQLRDLLDFKPEAPARPIEDVQSINEIRKRFVTPGMSLGALSPEAHGTLNIAMNRIGAK